MWSFTWVVFKIIVIYFIQGRFIQECDFGFSLENDTGRPKKRLPYCYMPWFLEFFWIRVGVSPCTATLLSICQGSEGRPSGTGLFLQVSQDRQLGIVIACIWRAVSWLLAHGLAPAYEVGPGSTTEQGTRLCPPVFVWNGAPHVCLQAAWCHKACKKHTQIIERYPKDTSFCVSK